MRNPHPCPICWLLIEPSEDEHDTIHGIYADQRRAEDGFDQMCRQAWVSMTKFVQGWISFGNYRGSLHLDFQEEPGWLRFTLNYHRIELRQYGVMK